MKKPILFGVMGLIFGACLYFIFGRDTGSKTTDEIKIGINEVVPQASEDGLPTDKGKAYEQEMQRQREQQKKEAMMSLSDYWQSASAGDSITTDATTAPKEAREGQEKQKGSPALSSYRNMQRSLNTFYQPQAGQEALRKENEALKEKLEAKEAPQQRSNEDRLALMEQSFKMAAKYFPGGTAPVDQEKASTATKKDDENFVAVQPGRKSVVSQLQRQVPDSVTRARLANAEFNGFQTPTVPEETGIVASSIKACVHQTGKITADSNVQLRLVQDARIGETTLPSGFILSAVAKFQQNRLQLQVVSIEVDGSILPVNLTVYDLDGQQGLNVPYAPEVSAVNGTLANMGNTAGSSFTINRSAGQQLVADASRGVIQGVSGYFSKKVRAQKVTLKAGHQVYLVSKKK
ncbi:conjugative transposon protein TraM [Flavobacterium psychrotrophum]|uniref:conjugative transposon protein TraM n=1 Tax=Flavobacterium psychrotrophum TaxID=2294119 RepID=UPI0013C40876|nr:conjugative transposon protein TraM [Flavobacterium psychrotrophum]